MRRILSTFWMAIATALLTTAALAAQGPHFGSWGFDLSAMDTTVRPGEDFNRYASGAWLARTEIPADKSIISLRVLQSDAITVQLHDLLEAARAHADPATLEGKAGAFYAAFMDEARVERLGSGPLTARSPRSTRRAIARRLRA
jgi:putative endopeptidase